MPRLHAYNHTTSTTVTGITDLATLVSSMQPSLDDRAFVFTSLPDAAYGDQAELQPIATIAEEEGLTLIISQTHAESHGLPYDDVFRMITLRVHSSLMAVGLTAAIATALARHGISANVVAGYHHDHVFIPTDRANEAMSVLNALAQSKDIDRL